MGSLASSSRELVVVVGDVVEADVLDVAHLSRLLGHLRVIAAIVNDSIVGV